MGKSIKTGIATAAMCLALASCHEYDFTPISDGEAAYQNYENVFIAKYGEPNPNHTWGFGDATRSGMTRSANTDGKSWLQNGYDNIPPADTKNYEAAVTEIFRDEAKWKKYQVTGIDFSDFFVQQVHKGANDVCKYTSYKDGNGTTHEVYGPNLMNQLVCQKKDGTVEHVNNFNYAEFNYGNWNQEVWNGQGGEDGYNDQNNLYKDAIILMQNSGTNAFGWSNSDDNGFNYLDAYMIIEYPENSGYYYVGFDYYRRSDGILCDNYTNKQNEINNKETEYKNNSAGWSEDQKKSALDEIERLKGELANYADCYKNGDKIVDRDYKYDDWIVRITPAKKQLTPSSGPTPLRIIAEDLPASAGDFDFNDVVFDVQLNWPETGKHTITLQAAGGTMPLYIGYVGGTEIEFSKGKPNNVGDYFEVHKAFGVETGKMVNTHDWTATKEPVTIVITGNYSNENEIAVRVKKGNDLPLLTAETGKVPSKLAVSVTYKWCEELKNIEEVYGEKFKTYINDPSVIWYEPTPGTGVYNKK